MSMEREMRCGRYPRISLAACRVNAKMTKTEMAYRLDVLPVMVEAWEKGEKEPELEQLRKISEISGVPMNFIYVEDKFEGYKSAHQERMEQNRKEILETVEKMEQKRKEFLEMVENLKNPHRIELIHIFVSKLCK